jgi:hypothetical protein
MAVDAHPVEPGALGEYVALLLRAGPNAAGYAFPTVAGHLSWGGDDHTGCRSCNDDALELRIALLEEATTQGVTDRGSLKDPLPRVHDRDRLEVFQKIRDVLPERHRCVVELRYGLLDGLRRTVHDVATALAITEEHTRRLEAEALRWIPGLQGLGEDPDGARTIVDIAIDVAREAARRHPRDGADPD